MTNRLHINLAVQLLHQGGVIAYPTEAVFGIGCDPLDDDAVYRLLAIKQRPVEKGLILIASDFNQLSPYIGELSGEVAAKINASWPGPTTWLVPKSDIVPPWLSGDHDTIAVRVSAHPTVSALCNAFGGAIVSTSANHHGKPAARSALKVKVSLGEEVDYILSGDVDRNSHPTPIIHAINDNVIRQ